MGKYMRKCKGAMGEEVAAMEVTQAVGVRTRSKAAAAKVVVSKRRKQALLPAPPPATLPRAAGVAASRGEAAGGGSCYLKLRSRMLFMAPPPAPRAEAAAGAAAGPGAVLAAGHGLSRCSSTASSVDAAAQDRSLLPCRSDAAKAGSDYIPEGSASNNSESGRDRERRETTPSSHRLPAAGELSDLESDLAGKNSSQSPAAATTAAAQEAGRARMPPAAEIEEFFAAAEEAQAQRFASKYNFDIARGVPLDAGRFEWTPAVGSSS